MVEINGGHDITKNWGSASYSCPVFPAPQPQLLQKVHFWKDRVRNIFFPFFIALVLKYRPPNSQNELFWAY